MKTVLIVDDDKVSLMTARNVLNDFYKIIAVTEGKQALKYLEKSTCDLILLDLNMPGMDGFEVNREIRMKYRDLQIPVVFLTSSNDAETETKCFEEGALDFISKPFVPSVILSRVHRIIETEELKKQLAERLDRKIKEYNEIKITSSRDVLTGLWTRKYAEAEISTFIENCEAGALFMMDLDNFKSVNDVYGHQAGDDVLRLFANCIVEALGESALVSRLGGDEFMAFIKDESDREKLSEAAQSVIDLFIRKFADFKFDTNTSASVGISVFPQDAKDYATLYGNADKALYYVKNNGKNSFRFYGDKKNGEAERETGLVNINMLDEFIGRSDVGDGAYLLDYESFGRFFNFFKRVAARDKGKLHTILFTIFSSADIDEESDEYKKGIEAAMNRLQETVHKSVRKADVCAKYSGKQLIVVLFDAASQNVLNVATRINDKYNELNEDERFKFTFEISEIKGRS
ncbi:MAG: diguanylate cyclase [Clostridiales bacterium]|nr:diguanylate cyclase [Clostridiales bacterium]